MNLINLYDSTKKFKAWRASYSQNQQWNLKNIIPFVGTRTLLFQATCFGETVHGEHIVNLQFNNIEFSEEKHPDFKEIEYKGEKYYYRRPTVKNDILIRCSCPDMIYRFSYANKLAKVWFGSMPKKYKKKTNRKPLNPDHIPGICKHIYQLQSYLRTMDYMD